MTNYKTLLDGARGLLGDCVKILSGINKNYVIVGGWSPFLLNSGKIKHPGTHDVDLLFSDGKSEGELKDIFQLFLNNGYMTSAKHNFQLLKIILVEDHKFVYNVDFLHSSDNQGNSDMFVDHLKLPIPLNEYQDSTYMQMSIKAPKSEVIFSEKLYEDIEQEFILPDDRKEKFSFPLINEAGLIITKSDSVKQVKRKRDSLDIYLAIKQARKYENLVLTFKEIKNNNGDLFNTLYGIKEAINKNDMVNNILDYIYEENENKFKNNEGVDNDLNKFFDDVGLDNKAKHNYYDQ